MNNDPVELWLPSSQDALPECLLGTPLLVLPQGESFFRLVTSSLLTPLTWGDSVRAAPHPDGGYLVTALAAAGQHLRVVLAHGTGVPAMHARRTAAEWGRLGAVTVETVGGLVITAWEESIEPTDVEALVQESPREQQWRILEIWTPTERTPATLAEHLHLG